jgi:hypothetical protein
MRALLAAAVILLLSSPAIAGPFTWRITKAHWTQADEKGFQNFVTAIGNSDCSSSESCVRGAANPWRGSDPRGFDIDSDCAKWPYFLRAYYAWKHGLPFSYDDAINGEGNDLRYTKTANHATSRHDIIDHGNGIDGPAAILAMMRAVYSGTYRTDVRDNDGVLSDFYSPAIGPDSIKPGSVVYDINGHVGIVWKIDSDGRIYYMDAHPDFSVTRSVYGAQFGQSPPWLGGGFKNWRPLRLVGAHRVNGYLIGGHMAFAKNDQIADFSLVQYAGTGDNPKADVKKAEFTYDGDKLGFYEYVRAAVSGGKMDYNPVFELKATMKTLCNDMNDRRQYVVQTVDAGVVEKPHPAHLPDNIYGVADPTWESYATPSRDSRLRAAFVQFYKDMDKMIQLWIARDPRIVYDGQFLKQDLLAAYEAESQACTLTYLSSDKHPVTLTFDDMMHNLYGMSFDPYDCVELRWGDKRDSCSNGPEKMRWYDQEQRLRNEITEDDGTPMDFTLAQLAAHKKGSGVDDPPPVDVKALIENMGEQVSFQGMTPVGH